MSDLSLLEAQLKVIREGLEEMVERLRSLEGAIQKQDGEWDPSRIKWVKAEGAKGPYERADPQATKDYQNMLKDLKEHGGRLTRDGYFYWVFQDQATVGRKKR